MIKFLIKLVVLWEKKKFLTLMEMESGYITRVNRNVIGRDIDYLRSKLRELKIVKNPTNDARVKMVEIEALINETEKYKQMLESSRSKGDDLKKQIKMYREEL